jgi:hypothetical protein
VSREPFLALLRRTELGWQHLGWRDCLVWKEAELSVRALRGSRRQAWFCGPGYESS